MSTTNQTIYPTAAVGDQTLSGANVIKKIADSIPAVNSTTQATWTAATVSDITLIPLTNNSTTGTDSTSNNGWAENNGGADGLGSVSTAKRIIPAGVWNFQGELNLNQPALLQTVSCTIRAKVYRVATGGGARTLLFTSNTSGAITNNSATSAVDAPFSFNSASQPQITLEAGEVIEIGYIINSAATKNVLNQITNTVIKFYLGTQTTTNQIQVPSPGIRTLYFQSNAATSTATAVKGMTKIIKSPISATATATAAIAKRITGHRAFSAISTATAAFHPRLMLKRSFSATSTATAHLGAFLIKLRALSATSHATAAFGKRLQLRRAFSATSTATAAISRRIFKNLSATSHATAFFHPSLRFKRSFSATSTATAKLFVQLPQAILNRMTGGGITIIKKIISLIVPED